MTYQQGSAILATDYGSFAGLTGSAAASSVAATNVAGYLWGIGFGDRGYGQASPTLTAVSAGQTIGSSEWTTLRSIMSSLATWQNTASALIPPTSAIASGAAITAHTRTSPSFNNYDIPAELVLLDTNRLNSISTNMLLSSLITSTRATAWGVGSTGITCTLQVTFASENAARYFFNTGGEIRTLTSHSDVSTTKNRYWNIVANQNIAFRANSTARLAGTNGTVSASIGYFQLTTTFQTIMDATSTNIYSMGTNGMLIEARSTAITGLNGAKGNVLEFRITLSDNDTSAPDSVASGTQANLSSFSANSISILPTAIAVPTGAVTVAF